ncbi:ABC transporter permease [Desulfitibacter alkalitolerans]|uniref:ABC transporter permease n=1 Tax=Desulfitibacter alkalitolerans TaxID=264641 RepID=UPI00146FA59C|nr:ABC transporter permease [Desulfitibacter alkalitolerans]
MIHIRQILHRAFLLIAVFAAVAAMVALCFTTVAQFYIMEAVEPDFLSDNSVKVEIHQSNEGEPLVQTKDLLEYFSLQGGSLIVYRSYPIANGKAVFLSADTGFKPNIIEGRSFSTDDFEQQAAVALIDARIRDRGIERDGELYFLHEGNEYKVIGIYKTPTARQYGGWGDTSGALYYVNMAAAIGNNLDTPLSGIYSIDAKEKSMDSFDGFTTYAKKINPQINMRAEVTTASTSEHLMQSIRNTQVLIIAFALTIILVLLNVFSTTYYWLEGRYKELAVRIMSGAGTPSLRGMLLRDYLLIVTIGYGIGLALAMLIIKAGWFPFIGESVHLSAVAVGYLLCLAVGTVTGLIALALRLKQEIITQIRG